MARLAARPVIPTLLELLRHIDSPTVSNAIERFDVRPRNEGFLYGVAQCMFPDFPPMVGYAVTASVRTSSQPVCGGYYHDHFDFWSYIKSQPAPHVLVIEDVDEMPGFGALIGEIHATIAGALGCAGCLTNGVVRDLPRVEALRFQLFARGVAPSHAYAHVVEFGSPVRIGNLKIEAGDLLHGDRHGVVTIPKQIAAEIPAMAERVNREEQELMSLCRSPRFSLARLRSALDQFRVDVPTQPRRAPTGSGPVVPRE